MGRKSSISKDSLVIYNTTSRISTCRLCGKTLRGYLLGNIKRHYRNIHNQTFDQSPLTTGSTNLKIENVRTTAGSREGSKCKVTEIDSMVGDIRNESALTMEALFNNPLSISSEDETQSSIVKHEKNDVTMHITQPIRPAFRKRNSVHPTDKDRMIDLERKKMQLELYNLKLDALKKERELGLPPSSLTSDIIRRSSSSYHDFKRFQRSRRYYRH